MKIVIPVINPGREKRAPGAPLIERGAPRIVSINQTQSRHETIPTDFLSRLLIQLPRRGEILKRLSLIPFTERFQALAVLLALEEKSISLNSEQWDELWKLIRKKTVPFPGLEEDVRKLIHHQESGRGEELLVQGQPNKNILLTPFNENGRKGQIIIKSEEGSENLFIRIETTLRHWEFHLIKPKKKGILSIMDVFTNDRTFIASPPGDWDEFRKKMKKKSIRVERPVKFLREPVFLSENRKRELDHLVDIVL